ncbi:MAG: hypothetical protein ACLP9L_05010 [Thermoguttaceae bacterium]|jgi:hypothetical protein
MNRSKRAEKAELAWQAIDYLVEHDLVLKWDFPEADPPPEEIRKLIAPYFSDGEIEMTAAWLLSDFLIERLENDCLLIRDSQSSQDPHRPRVVCGDDD